jgi:leucyl aminopeptidase
MIEFRAAAGEPLRADVGILALPLVDPNRPDMVVEAASARLGLDLASTFRSGRRTAGHLEPLVVPTLGRLPANEVALFGVESPASVPFPAAERLRRAITRSMPQMLHARSVGFVVAPGQTDGRGDAHPDDVVQAVVEGVLLGNYRFDRYLTSGRMEPRPLLHRVVLLGASLGRGTARAAIRRAEIVARAVAWCRDLVNTPALEATPAYLAEEASRMARQVGLGVRVWTPGQLERGGFGGILGVGRGSVNAPRLIELRSPGSGRRPAMALTGKGVTFDSGGTNLKDADNMQTMKTDMAAAAAILGVMRVVAELAPELDVVAALPSSENMPGGSAIRPRDVLRHRGGRTTEVMNTDAEGRLLLADSLALLAERQPSAIVDAATLGAGMTALGVDLFAIMGTDRSLVKGLLEAGRSVGEPGWELPLWEPYRRDIDSEVADLRNVPDTRLGGPIHAALFLREFVGTTPWAHLDVAGTVYREEAGDHGPAGATGAPVRTLVRYLLKAPSAGGVAPEEV